MYFYSVPRHHKYPIIFANRGSLELDDVLIDNFTVADTINNHTLTSNNFIHIYKGLAILSSFRASSFETRVIYAFESQLVLISSSFENGYNSELNGLAIEMDRALGLMFFVLFSNISGKAGAAMYAHDVP